MTHSSPSRQLGFKQLLLRGFAWTFTQSVGGLLVQGATLVILSRLLTPGDFGIVAIAVSLIGVVSLVVELGVGPALIQRKDVAPRHIGSAIWLSLVSAVSLMAILQLTAMPIVSLLGMPETSTLFRFLALIVILQPLNTILSSLARRHLDMRHAATADLIGATFGYSAVAITLAYLGFGFWALAIGQISQLAVTLAMLAFSQRRRISFRAGRAETGHVLAFGAFFSIGRLANYAAQKLDRVLIGMFLGVDAAGHYQRVLNMLQMVGPFVAGPLDAIMFPLLSRLQDDASRLRRSYRATTAMAALVTVPASVVMCVSAPVMVPLVLGPQWHGVILPAQIMAGVLFFRTNDSITATLVRAVGKVKGRAALQVLYAILSLGSIFLLGDFGLASVAAGLLGVTIFNFVLMSFLIRHVTTMSISDNFAPLLPGVLLGTGLALLAGALYLAIGDAMFTLTWMCGYIVGCALVYLALLVATPASLFPPEIASLRATIRQRLLDELGHPRSMTAPLDAVEHELGSR